MPKIEKYYFMADRGDAFYHYRTTNVPLLFFADEDACRDYIMKYVTVTNERIFRENFVANHHRHHLSPSEYYTGIQAAYAQKPNVIDSVYLKEIDADKLPEILKPNVYNYHFVKITGDTTPENYIEYLKQKYQSEFPLTLDTDA